jgi:hypothetical protein
MCRLAAERMLHVRLTDWGDAAKLQYHCITARIAVLLKRREASGILMSRNILRQQKQASPPAAASLFVSALRVAP